MAEQPQIIADIALDEIEVGIDTTDIEVIHAAKYLVLKEVYHKTHQQIAEIFGKKHRNSVYTMIANWNDSGALEKARAKLNQPKTEDIKSAHSEVLEQWPNVIRTILRIALHGKSDKNKLESAAWLNHEVIKPQLERRDDAGTAESDYASRAASINPNEISLPIALANRIRRLEEK
jgi:hypothetical protein